MNLNPIYLILGQSTTTQASDSGQSPMFMIFVALAGVLLFLMMTKSSKKQRKNRDELLKNLKRGDRIQTIGGMLATVVDVDKDKDEVTLKIDETSNAKAKFVRSAIHTVITDKKSSDQAK